VTALGRACCMLLPRRSRDACPGLAHHPSAEGERVSGICRQRVTLASGRFAMTDDGLGFQLMP
jgi:Protein of unknown function (DUF3363)